MNTPDAIGLAGSPSYPRPFTLARIRDVENVWGFGAVHWSAKPGDDVGFGIVADKIRPRRGPYRDRDENGIQVGPWKGEQDVAVLQLEEPATVEPLEVLWEVPPSLDLEIFFTVDGKLESQILPAEFRADGIEWLRGYWIPKNGIDFLSGAPALTLDGKLAGVLVGSGGDDGVINSIAYCLREFPAGFPVWDRRKPPSVALEGSTVAVEWEPPSNGWNLARSEDLAEWSVLGLEPLDHRWTFTRDRSAEFFRLQKKNE